MPTISGLRRRGYTPEAIRNFAEMVGVAKRDNVIDYSLLEYSVRDHLNKQAQRVMSVLRPIKVILTNYPEGQIEEMEAVNNPEDETMGTRMLPFSRELFIDMDDFKEDPPKKYYRLSPGSEVRLRYAYIIKCDEVIKDPATGEIIALHCSYDPETKSGVGTSTKKVKATIHWVSAQHAIEAEVRLYDRLFNSSDPAGDKEVDFLSHINKDSLEILKNCKIEPFLKNAKIGERFQFERLGYFAVDNKNTTTDNLVFNRTATLKDAWTKIENAKNK
jgi:glutaminyl-tRNA synthetase